MAKKTTFRRPDIVLADGEWLLVINALLNDKAPSSKDLAARLLMETKPGRQIRIARLLAKKPRKGKELQKLLGMSRRTMFRDLNNLEEYGFQVKFDDNFRYEIGSIPAKYKKLIESTSLPI